VFSEYQHTCEEAERKEVILWINLKLTGVLNMPLLWELTALCSIYASTVLADAQQRRMRAVGAWG